MKSIERIIALANALDHRGVYLKISEFTGCDDPLCRWNVSVFSSTQAVHSESNRTLDEALNDVEKDLTRWVQQRRDEAISKVRHFEKALELPSNPSDGSNG